MATESLVLPEYDWLPDDGREWTPEYDWLFNKQTGEHDQTFYLTNAQEVILHDQHRFKVIVAGRRWGKTIAALTDLIASADNFPRSKNWYVAPTRVMAKDIAWEDLEFLQPTSAR